jgi:hypothetical protein
MSRLLVTVVAALAVCMSSSSESLAQARGPSAKEIQEGGQKVQSMLEARRQEWERDWGQETRAREREEMRRDSALSASRLAEMNAFLRRLTGRFRIEGTIERKVPLTITIREPRRTTFSIQFVPQIAKVAGVVDCTAVGDGAGVNCLISASWPAFDRIGEPPPFCGVTSRSRLCEFLDPDYTPAEMLDTMRPAVLMLGLDTDPPQLRGMMVTADTLTNEWAGKLDGNTARLLQTQVCTTLRCYIESGISAEADGEVVTITLQQRLLWGVTITLTMHRDPTARLEKELKPMRAR